MFSINRHCIMGRLGQDPDVRNDRSGNAIVNLSIATSESWKDKQTGEQKEKTEWHRVVIFGRLAEVADKYLAKGSKVYVEGQVRTRKWQDQSGADRFSTETVLSGFDCKLILLDGRNGDQGGGSGRSQRQDTGGYDSSTSTGGGDDGFFDDDIPF